MGLNLETLIGILVLLILLIIGDGLRRIWRDRQSKLHIRIERCPEDERVATDSADFPSGGARPAKRGDDAPPIIMEEDDRQSGAVISEGVQTDLFGMSDDDDLEEMPAMRATRDDQVATPSTDRGKKRPSEDPAPEALVVHLLAVHGARMPGRQLLQALLESGLRYGEMRIFHHHRVGSAQSTKPVLQYSVANAVEPGTFDIDAMEEETFAGITFFLTLPGPDEPLKVLESMLAVARRIADTLNAELKDETRSVLTQQTIEHMRQRVQDFERRQRLSHGG